MDRSAKICRRSAAQSLALWLCLLAYLAPTHAFAKLTFEDLTLGEQIVAKLFIERSIEVGSFTPREIVEASTHAHSHNQPQRMLADMIGPDSLSRIIQVYPELADRMAEGRGFRRAYIRDVILEAEKYLTDQGIELAPAEPVLESYRRTVAQWRDQKAKQDIQIAKNNAEELTRTLFRLPKSLDPEKWPKTARDFFSVKFDFLKDEESKKRRFKDPPADLIQAWKQTELQRVKNVSDLLKEEKFKFGRRRGDTYYDAGLYSAAFALHQHYDRLVSTLERLEGTPQQNLAFVKSMSDLVTQGDKIWGNRNEVVFGRADYVGGNFTNAGRADLEWLYDLHWYGEKQAARPFEGHYFEWNAPVPPDSVFLGHSEFIPVMEGKKELSAVIAESLRTRAKPSQSRAGRRAAPPEFTRSWGRNHLKANRSHLEDSNKTFESDRKQPLPEFSLKALGAASEVPLQFFVPNADATEGLKPYSPRQSAPSFTATSQKPVEILSRGWLPILRADGYDVSVTDMHGKALPLFQDEHGHVFAKVERAQEQSQFIASFTPSEEPVAVRLATELPVLSERERKRLSDAIGEMQRLGFASVSKSLQEMISAKGENLNVQDVLTAIQAGTFYSDYPASENSQATGLRRYLEFLDNQGRLCAMCGPGHGIAKELMQQIMVDHPKLHFEVEGNYLREPGVLGLHRSDRHAALKVWEEGTPGHWRIDITAKQLDPRRPHLNRQRVEGLRWFREGETFRPSNESPRTVGLFRSFLSRFMPKADSNKSEKEVHKGHGETQQKPAEISPSLPEAMTETHVTGGAAPSDGDRSVRPEEDPLYQKAREIQRAKQERNVARKHLLETLVSEQKNLVATLKLDQLTFPSAGNPGLPHPKAIRIASLLPSWVEGTLSSDQADQLKEIFGVHPEEPGFPKVVKAHLAEWALPAIQIVEGATRAHQERRGNPKYAAFSRESIDAPTRALLGTLGRADFSPMENENIEPILNELRAQRAHRPGCDEALGQVAP